MIAVAGGGTGGHIFPAMSVIEELKRRGVHDICWIGDRKGRERVWAEHLGIEFHGIHTGKLRRYLSLRNITDGFSVLQGIMQSRRILKGLGVRVLFSKGGFVSVPPAIAARLLHIPVVTHESDIVPGLATRIIARHARVVCLSFERVPDIFRHRRTVHTGNPIRGLIRNADPERGRRFINFREEMPIVTVLGGSLGASSLNRAVRELVDTGMLPFNLVHQCGEGKAEGRKDRTRYRRYEFIGEEMGDVLAASDLVISRAGAGLLNEIAFLGKPSVLIPLPITVSRGEQVENARYFRERGASVVIEDRRLNAAVLSATVSELLNEPDRLTAMGRCAKQLFKPHAEERVVDILVDILEGT
jgi:UDP-N-acetylglucosamine--N-acetylmuramyl-(pentapeptide) pyrophosphoryl-undecaprenol N-acetylglucosamine transferase